MKTILIIFLISFIAEAQVIIEPYVVYIDQQQRFGSYTVQNESNEEYEITVSFIFGYTISDSTGNTTLKYDKTPVDSLPSIVNWIRAFPKSFVLAPKEHQIVRMSVRPPDSISAGTYWARIVTSATPRENSMETQTAGINAKIKFILNQVTTVLYRKEPATTGIILHNVYANTDSTNLNIYADLERTGNSPFWCDLFATVTDTTGNIIAENRNYGPIYYRLVKKVPIELNKLSKGKYKIDVKVEFNEKEDIPESKLGPIPSITKTIYYTVKN